MTVYNRVRKKIGKDFDKLMKQCESLFYYGCDVDRWIIEIIILPYITLPWKKDPTWYRIIAPPGSGKSKHLSLLDDFELSYIIDEFTPKSFISGFRTGGGEDPSKLPQFDGKVLIISDESTLMEQRQEDRNVVQSILRKAYDGKVSKGFGNIKEVQTYKSHFNLLVGSTPQIDRYFLYNQALGERYVNYRAQIPDRKAIASRAYENQFIDFQKKYLALKRSVHKFIRKLPETEMTDIEIPGDMQHFLIDCADFITLVRTRITRDATGRHVTTLPQAETAGRLVQQMTQTAVANAILHGDKKLDMSHIEKSVYLGLGSMTAIISFLLHHVWLLSTEEGIGTGDSWFSVQHMCVRTALGRGSVARILEDLAIHRILNIRACKKQGGRLMEYSLSTGAASTIDSIQLFKNYSPPCKEILELKRADRIRPTGTNFKRKVHRKGVPQKGKTKKKGIK